MAELALNPKERQALKGRAHALNPIVLLGAGGLSEAVVHEVDRALTAHELIKVRVPGDDRDEREAVFAELAARLSAARVQAIGKLLVLYRPRPEPLPEAAHDRSDKAPARRPAGPARTTAPQRGKPDRRDIRQGARTTAPRRGGARSR